MIDLTMFVCTRESEATLGRCLASLRKFEPDSPIVVVDHESKDSTVDIAQNFGAEIHTENIGLGYARQLAFELVKTRYLAFVDGDEEVVQPQFFRAAVKMMQSRGVGAVVGMAVAHRYSYGLPMGLLVLRSEDFQGKVISSDINAREEYFVRKRLESLGMSTVFVADAKIHRSQYRRYKPEWEGANTRIASGVSPAQLLFVLRVILLQSFNSRSLKNIVYVPVFYLKFLRGFVRPGDWRDLRLTR